MNKDTDLSQCAICKNSRYNRHFFTQERLMGFGDEFEYFECARCGCVQIARIPENIDKYYPDNYYSYETRQKSGRFHAFVVRQIMRYHLGKFNLFGGLIYSMHKDKPYGWMKKGILDFDSSILDVGCGSGATILKMNCSGFKNVHGIDPFIATDIHYSNNVSIEKQSLSAVKEQYDFVMLHHSLEHMADQYQAMKDIYRVLKPGHYALVRIPVSSSHNWRKYGPNYFSLDPPRHFYLHSIQSFEILAQKTGFELKFLHYDADNYARLTIESERYQRNLSGNNADFFSKKQIRRFEKEINRLNRLNDGDTVCLYIYKPLA